MQVHAAISGATPLVSYALKCTILAQENFNAGFFVAIIKKKKKGKTSQAFSSWPQLTLYQASSALNVSAPELPVGIQDHLQHKRQSRMHLREYRLRLH